MQLAAAEFGGFGTVLKVIQEVGTDFPDLPAVKTPKWPQNTQEFVE